MLDANNIYVSYGKSQVINGISLHVNKGDKLAILGRNGVGKTSLLKSLIRILPISKGSV